MTTLVVGFDSAWTAKKSGALVGVLRQDDRTYLELGQPHVVNYKAAEATIQAWQTQHKPAATIVMLDQPTIVKNDRGQRPVENLVSSPVSLRYGGMQPANTAKVEMFGKDAPVWQFLDRFGGPANPDDPLVGPRVFETYPVLIMIALGWCLPDDRPEGRLPKYNPERRGTFSNSDWRYVCQRAGEALSAQRLPGLVRWLEKASALSKPRKQDQDALDACLCLLPALQMVEGEACLSVGDLDTGYIVAPWGEELHQELERRCIATGRNPAEWVTSVRLH